MSDVFADRVRSPSDPATSVFDITPDDAADLPAATTGLNVATTGSVRVTTVDGSTTDLQVVSGYLFPVRVTKVWANGTTATGIRGLV